MSGYSSTHSFGDGTIVTVSNYGDEIALRIQGENEKMLCDIVMPKYSGLCVAHAILSVITKDEEDS